MTSINNHSLPFSLNQSGNSIGDTGTTSLSDALKSNTTLTQLNLGSNLKKKKTTQTPFINNTLTFIPIKLKDNEIGDIGAKSLSDALKSNTTLTKFNLCSKNKTNKKQTTIVHSIKQQTMRLET